MIDLDRLEAFRRAIQDANRERTQLVGGIGEHNIHILYLQNQLDSIEVTYLPWLKNAIFRRNAREEKAKLESHKGSL